MTDNNLIRFAKITDQPHGSLTFIENSRDIPFDVKRVFYTYDFTNKSSRGGHAHRTLSEIVIALSGSFKVRIEFNGQVQNYLLDEPDVGLLIKPKTWLDLYDFSKDAVCLVLTSDFFSEKDYIRSYDEFKKIDLSQW